MVLHMMTEPEVQPIQNRITTQAHGVIQGIIGSRLRTQEVIGKDIPLPQGVGHHERYQHRKQRQRTRDHRKYSPGRHAVKRLTNRLATIQTLELLAPFGLEPQHQLCMKRERIGQEEIAVPGA